MVKATSKLGEYALTKDYAEKLEKKKNLFRDATQTKHTLFTTLIASRDVKQNGHFAAAVDNYVTLDDLFSDN